jgi:hypothetical protein
VVEVRSLLYYLNHLPNGAEVRRAK